MVFFGRIPGPCREAGVGVRSLSFFALAALRKPWMRVFAGHCIHAAQRNTKAKKGYRPAALRGAPVPFRGVEKISASRSVHATKDRPHP